jgi:serine/alanine adding enzyme
MAFTFLEPPSRTAAVPSGPTEVVADLPAHRWDDYVSRAAMGTAYHLTRWREVFERAFGHRCHYLAATRGGQVVGVLPLVEFKTWLFGHFAVSLPFVNYGGVIADDRAGAQALANAAWQLARERGFRHVELRHVAQQFPELPVKRHKVAMTLALPATAAGLWDAIDRKARNQVRKAEKSGLVSVSGGPELLDGFYDVFAVNMRDLGTPVYPRRFFDLVTRLFPERARVHQVRLGEQVIAASITLGWRSTVEVPWASSLQTHRDKSPNNLLYWSMLQYAIDQRFTTFDFGRSTPGEGTYHFKTQWGAEASPLNWEYWLHGGSMPDQSPKNPKFRLAIATWRRLPLWVANRVGPRVVRNLP